MGSQVKKSLTYKVIGKGGGCIFYCVLRGKTKYSHIIIAIKFLLSYLYKEILKYRKYMYTLFCMLCQ